MAFEYTWGYRLPLSTSAITLDHAIQGIKANQINALIAQFLKNIIHPKQLNIIKKSEQILYKCRHF